MPGFHGTPQHVDDGEVYELKAPSSTPLYGDADVTIVDWRCDCFVELGFDLLDASVMAQRRDVDRVEVERLLASGATHVQVRDLVL